MPIPTITLLVLALFCCLPAIAGEPPAPRSDAIDPAIQPAVNGGQLAIIDAAAAGHDPLQWAIAAYFLDESLILYAMRSSKGTDDASARAKQGIVSRSDEFKVRVLGSDHRAAVLALALRCSGEGTRCESGPARARLREIDGGNAAVDLMDLVDPTHRGDAEFVTVALQRAARAERLSFYFSEQSEAMMAALEIERPLSDMKKHVAVDERILIFGRWMKAVSWMMRRVPAILRALREACGKEAEALFRKDTAAGMARRDACLKVAALILRDRKTIADAITAGQMQFGLAGNPAAFETAGEAVRSALWVRDSASELLGSSQRDPEFVGRLTADWRAYGEWVAAENAMDAAGVSRKPPATWKKSPEGYDLRE